MCLPIDSCFGFGTPRTDDDRCHAPASRTQQSGQQRHYNGNSNGAHYNGNGNSNGAHYHGNGVGVRRDPAHVVPAVAPAPRGRHGHAATAAQEKASAYAYADEYETLKQQPPAAWNGKVAADGHGARGGAPHSYYYANERAHKDATATAADQESPSEAPGVGGE